MTHALVFVAAPEADLPQGSPTWQALCETQRRSIGSGVALRLFRSPAGDTVSLEGLPGDGTPGPAAPGHRLLCDAVVPYLDPRTLWLGVYALEDFEPGDPPDPQGCTPSGRTGAHPLLRLSTDQAVLRCLDRFPLREAENETCWFYPTDNGTYLSWENRRRLALLPGFLPDHDPRVGPIPYERGDVHVLWSLMADDRALTCVGLTHRRRRIEWPVVAAVPEDLSTWTAFRIDTMADPVYEELATQTVFAPRDPASTGD